MNRRTFTKSALALLAGLPLVGRLLSKPRVHKGGIIRLSAGTWKWEDVSDAIAWIDAGEIVKVHYRDGRTVTLLSGDKLTIEGVDEKRARRRFGWPEHPSSNSA